jgi:rhodanese-related sulfurtransferase
MKRNTIIYTLLFLVASILAAPVISQAQSDSAKYVISNKKFKRLSHKANTVVIDVRTPEEYASGYIPGALNMDVKGSAFTQQVVALDKSKRYLLYCRSGKRSAKALQILKDNGFDHVYHLAGGIEQWNGLKQIVNQEQ